MRPDEMERRFNQRWGDLAEFNAERHRGVNHSPEYVIRMKKKQAQYDFMRERGLDVWFDPIPDEPDLLKSRMIIDVHTDDVEMPIARAAARSTGDVLHKQVAIQIPAGDGCSINLVGRYPDLRRLAKQLAEAVDLEVLP